MPPTPFDSFCHALCEALGVPAPPANGVGALPPGMTLTLDGVDIGLVPVGGAGAAPGAADQVLVMVDYGPLPEVGADGALLALLQANFLAMDPNGPVFSVHPLHRRVVWHEALHLATLQVRHLATRLRALAASACDWRGRGGVAPPPPTPAWDGAWA